MWGHLNVTQRAFPWIQKQKQGNTSGSASPSCMWESEKEMLCLYGECFLVTQEKKVRIWRLRSFFNKEVINCLQETSKITMKTYSFWVAGKSQKVIVAFACVARQCFGSGLETFSTSWPLIQGTVIKTKIKKTPKKPIQSKVNI